MSIDSDATSLPTLSDVKVGDEVWFKNLDKRTHTLKTAISAPFEWISEPIRPGETFVFKSGVAGQFKYTSGELTGVVVVNWFEEPQERILSFSG